MLRQGRAGEKQIPFSFAIDEKKSAYSGVENEFYWKKVGLYGGRKRKGEYWWGLKANWQDFLNKR